MSDLGLIAGFGAMSLLLFPLFGLFALGLASLFSDRAERISGDNGLSRTRVYIHYWIAGAVSMVLISALGLGLRITGIDLPSPNDVAYSLYWSIGSGWLLILTLLSGLIVLGLGVWFKVEAEEKISESPTVRRKTRKRRNFKLLALAALIGILALFALSSCQAVTNSGFRSTYDPDAPDCIPTKFVDC